MSTAETETVQSETVTRELSTLTPPDDTPTRGHEQQVELDVAHRPSKEATIAEQLGEVDVRNKDDEEMPVDFENVLNGKHC